MKLLPLVLVGCFWCLQAFTPCEAETVSPYTLTINGDYIGGGEARIFLGVVGHGELNIPVPFVLALTNLSTTNLTYKFHSTGPQVTWQIQVEDKTFKFETFGQGSGVMLSRTLKPRQSGAIPVGLYYSDVPEIREMILAKSVNGRYYIKAKIKAKLSIETNQGYIEVESDWAELELGSSFKPEDALLTLPDDE